ncbi:MAG TPA: ABC transporter substrate-binding protein, partial [Xanthobacteraceae bacterium]
QAYMLAWSGRTDPDGNVYVFNVCKGPQNYSQMCDADADKALTEARTVSDVAARKAIYEKLAKVMLDQDPIVYIYHRRVLIGLNARVAGYRQMPDGLVRVIGLTLR